MYVATLRQPMPDKTSRSSDIGTFLWPPTLTPRSSAMSADAGRCGVRFTETLGLDAGVDRFTDVRAPPVAGESISPHLHRELAIAAARHDIDFHVVALREADGTIFEDHGVGAVAPVFAGALAGGIDDGDVQIL